MTTKRRRGRSHDPKPDATNEGRVMSTDTPTPLETAKFRRRDLVEAVQLTEDADWEAVAAWCSGELENQTLAPGEEPRTVLTVANYGYEAIEGDWVVRYETEDGPDFALYLPDQFEELFEPAGEAPGG